VVLDPRNLFSVDRTLTKDDVQKLIQVFCSFIAFLISAVGIILDSFVKFREFSLHVSH